MRPCHFFRRLVGVRRNGRLGSSLFHQCMSFCKKRSVILIDRLDPVILSALSRLNVINGGCEMRHFFKKRGYPDSVVNTAQHCVQQIDRQSALQTSQKEKNERTPFTLTYHPHNLAAKNIILKNLKLLQNDNETGRIFTASIDFIQTRQKHRKLSSEKCT